MGATVRCEYILTGAFDPDLVSSTTGLHATKVWRVGDRISSKSTRTYEFDGWMLSTDYEPCIDIEVPLQRLLEPLRAAQGAIVELIRKHGLEAEVSIVVKVVDDEIPATTIAASRLAEITGLGAGLDIDFILMR
jgi:hypothetical protein